MKRGRLAEVLVFYLVIALLFTFHSGIVLGNIGVNSLTPNKIYFNSLDPEWNENKYETTQSTVVIQLNAIASILLNYSIEANGVSVINVLTPTSGCSVSGTPVKSVFCSGDNPTFIANITRENVAADTTFSWEVVAYDSVSDRVEKNLTFEVLVDSGNPTVGGLSPGEYVMIGDNPIQITLEVGDAISGVNDGKINYQDNTVFKNDTRDETNITSYDMTCNATHCIYTLYPGNITNNYFNSHINVTDKAGNTNNSKLFHAFKDVSAPTISLSSPNNNSVLLGNGVQNFDFAINDDSFSAPSAFNATVSCILSINGTVYDTDSILVSGTASFTADLSGLGEGQHTTSLACTDALSRSTTSTSFFAIDRTAPNITVVSPANSSTVAESFILSLDITDASSGLSQAWYTFNSVNTTINLPYSFSLNASGQNNATLVVYANDTLGNLRNINLFYTVDSTIPNVTIALSSSDHQQAVILFASNENINYTLYYQISGSNITSSAVQNSLGFNQTHTLTGLTASTSYVVWSYGCDVVNLCNYSNNLSFTTGVTPSSGGSSGGSTGSSGSSSGNSGNGGSKFGNQPGSDSSSSTTTSTSTVSSSSISSKGSSSSAESSSSESTGSDDGSQNPGDETGVNSANTRSSGDLITGAAVTDVTGSGAGKIWSYLILFLILGFLFFILWKKRNDEEDDKDFIDRI